MENEIILSTVRVGPLDKETDGFQTVVTFEQIEGTTGQFRRRICVSDFYAGTLVRALLKEREEHVNRIAEMEDQIRSNQERADAEIESLKDELAEANERARIVAAVGA